MPIFCIFGWLAVSILVGEVPMYFETLLWKWLELREEANLHLVRQFSLTATIRNKSGNSTYSSPGTR